MRRALFRSHRLTNNYQQKWCGKEREISNAAYRRWRAVSPMAIFVRPLDHSFLWNRFSSCDLRLTFNSFDASSPSPPWPHALYKAHNRREPNVSWISQHSPTAVIISSSSLLLLLLLSLPNASSTYAKARATQTGWDGIGCSLFLNSINLHQDLHAYSSYVHYYLPPWQ